MVTRTSKSLAFSNPPRDFAAYAGDLAFELPQARFVGVLQDDAFERRTADRQMANRYAVLLHLFRE